MPGEVAYRVTRALHRGESALGARLPQARETTGANTVLAAPSLDRLHPGTRRYLAEVTPPLTLTTAFSAAEPAMLLVERRPP